ncbi:MAG: acyl-CoA dehydrogenase family protein [Wenzhouxiangellaceae bacterium]|nr:acyl-CoA dehydrogenase family protein [Wenzhouxiangellaceae bacterium]
MADKDPLSYIQQPPELGNECDDDWFLTAWLESALPEELLAAERPTLAELGERSGGEWYRFQLADRLNEPRLTRFSPWGERIDEIELTPLWQRARDWAAEYGLVATGYDEALAEHARTVQFARAWLYVPSTDFYGCPLAMTDGAARIIADSGNEALIGHALPRLLSRDPDRFWTSGQWMTETVGGSDVSMTETVARRDDDGTWRLTGRKWFTSAATSEMALTLARPEGNPEGSRGLALFYLEPHDGAGRLRNVEILRLKDKLGTRKLPTAELWLDDAPATPVGALERGVAAITPMLNLTRTWNAVTACSLMRRGLALATSYARKRAAFGRRLIDQPLHRQTLAALEADFAAAGSATMAMIAEMGRVETGHPDARPELWRMLTPMVKLGTGRDAVAVTSEVLEAFGGAGYIEDTGLPVLLRDVQVLSIWEGTTNVLALDMLRALGANGLGPWLDAMRARLAELDHPKLGTIPKVATNAVENAPEWLKHDDNVLEANARAVALNLYRTTALVELAGLARRRLGAGDEKPLVAARNFAANRFRLEPIDTEGLGQHLAGA